ncbi:hypothetical protein PF003_g837 [Phytophthora fragariae]|uniref:Uncharacterized protein n=1 Tax=Phytophthora fragariae TaxID=53985 RepID=A0A6A3ET54_9STRA|nr:hypothetical protein PF003_g837 [Phytophthora fragariae]KAE8935171.1 hypothetical protein PF009_g14866 [Phytophthora fragariae]
MQTRDMKTRTDYLAQAWEFADFASTFEGASLCWKLKLGSLEVDHRQRRKQTPGWCKEVGVSSVNETAATAETTGGGVAVHGRVGRESSGPRDRQDRQHDESRTSGSLDPTNAASSANWSSLTNCPANEQAGRLKQHALGSGCETNERKADEAWLDATTDSVDDYTAVTTAE